MVNVLALFDFKVDLSNEFLVKVSKDQLQAAGEHARQDGIESVMHRCLVDAQYLHAGCTAI